MKKVKKVEIFWLVTTKPYIVKTFKRLEKMVKDMDKTMKNTDLKNV